MSPSALDRSLFRGEITSTAAISRPSHTTSRAICGSTLRVATALSGSIASAADDSGASGGSSGQARTATSGRSAATPTAIVGDVPRNALKPAGSRGFTHRANSVIQ